MDTKNLTCIGCPLGCALTAHISGDTIEKVTGNTCKRGEDYARKELTHPTRIVTSTVRVVGGNLSMVSVKTKQDIPKEKIMDVMKSLAEVEIQAPVCIGDVIVPNAGETGVAVIATRDVSRC